MNITSISGMNYPSFKMVLIPNENYQKLGTKGKIELRSTVKEVGAKSEYQLPKGFFKIKQEDEDMAIIVHQLFSNDSTKIDPTSGLEISSIDRREKLETDITKALNSKYGDEFARQKKVGIDFKYIAGDGKKLYNPELWGKPRSDS